MLWNVKMASVSHKLVQLKKSQSLHCSLPTIAGKVVSLNSAEFSTLIKKLQEMIKNQLHCCKSMEAAIIITTSGSTQEQEWPELISLKPTHYHLSVLTSSHPTKLFCTHLVTIRQAVQLKLHTQATLQTISSVFSSVLTSQQWLIDNGRKTGRQKGKEAAEMNAAGAYYACDLYFISKYSDMNGILFFI